MYSLGSSTLTIRYVTSTWVIVPARFVIWATGYTINLCFNSSARMIEVTFSSDSAR